MALKSYNKYRYIFFDLDHTLWDFEKNSADTLSELYHKHELASLGTFCEDSFKRQFREVNSRLWTMSDEGKLDKETLRKDRFRLIFDGLGVENEEMAFRLGEDYVALCPQKPALLPHAMAILEYLHSKYYLYILTNGFSDVQAVKLASAGIPHFFRHVFTADELGAGKPDKKYFTQVLQKISAKPSECIMVGDNLKTDILGAQNAGIDHIYYNPAKRSYFMEVQHEINCLSELKELL